MWDHFGPAGPVPPALRSAKGLADLASRFPYLPPTIVDNSVIKEPTNAPATAATTTMVISTDFDLLPSMKLNSSLTCSDA